MALWLNGLGSGLQFRFMPVRIGSALPVLQLPVYPLASNQLKG